MAEAHAVSTRINAEATADGLRAVGHAIDEPGGRDAVTQRIAEKYVSELAESECSCPRPTSNALAPGPPPMPLPKLKHKPSFRVAVAKQSNMVIVPDRPNDISAVIATAMAVGKMDGIPKGAGGA